MVAEAYLSLTFYFNHFCCHCVAILFSVSGLVITLSGLMAFTFDFSLDELADRSHDYSRLADGDDDDALRASSSVTAITASTSSAASNCKTDQLRSVGQDNESSSSNTRLVDATSS